MLAARKRLISSIKKIYRRAYSAKSIAQIPILWFVSFVLGDTPKLRECNTCSGAEIEHSLRILNWSHGQFAAGEHEVYMMCEVHTSLLVVVVGLLSELISMSFVKVKKVRTKRCAPSLKAWYLRPFCMIDFFQLSIRQDQDQGVVLHIYLKGSVGVK